MEPSLISELDFTFLVIEGFYKGILFSVTVGFISQGLNYAYKLLSRS